MVNSVHSVGMNTWHELAKIGQEQHGVVTRRQAESCGLAPSTVTDQMKAGGLRRVGRGVAALPGAGVTPHAAILAAALSVGHQALAARWTALWLWGLLRRPPSTVHLIVPYARWAAESTERVTITRSRTLVLEDRDLAQGIAVTSVPRTLADMAGHVATPFLRGLVIDAVQRRLVTLGEVRDRATLMRNSAGLGRLRRICFELDVQHCDSVLEHDCRRRLRATSLPKPHPRPYEIVTHRGRRVIDVPWPDLRVGIECNGRAFHSDREALDKDGVRLTEIAVADWRIAHATWTRVEGRFGELVEDVERLMTLARRDLAVQAAIAHGIVQS